MLIDGSSSTIAGSALNTAVGIAFRESLLEMLGETGRRDLPFEVRPQILYNPGMRSPNFFVPGVIGVVLQIGTTFATAMSLVRERAPLPLELVGSKRVALRDELGKFVQPEGVMMKSSSWMVTAQNPG